MRIPRTSPLPISLYGRTSAKPNRLRADRPLHASLIGIYCKLGALLLFCTMDAMVESLGGMYGPFQLMLFRSAVALVPVAIIVWHAGDVRIVRSKRRWLQAVRICAGLGSMGGFFYVFPRMPLVDAYAISYAAPLFMVALWVPLLGEQVGWRRWTAVGVGFVGVLLMLDPWSIGIHLISPIAFAATFCYALWTVMMRMISRHDQDAATLFWLAVVSTLLSLVGAIPQWIWPAPADWFWLILLGLLGGITQVLITRAWRLAPAAIFAPSTIRVSSWLSASATSGSTNRHPGPFASACPWWSAPASISCVGSGSGPVKVPACAP